ncbi:MAG: PhoH family protein [Butyrivibrio sp.]|nr:PhoH family protein [Butyrivibrio sp.]
MSEITELTLSLSAEDQKNIFGGNDSYIRKIEKSFRVEIIDRNGQLHIIGSREDADSAAGILRELVQLSRRGSAIEEQNVDYAIFLKKENGEKPDVKREKENDNVLVDIDRDVICHTISGKPIKPKTLGQKKYIDAIRNNMIVFGLGPAGTGKTYLAMAMAITAFQREEVSRIILTRPAIEAGEKLGFLPGDLQSKVDPYLRPLYDALYQIMGTENFIKNMEKGLIEVAPLAYMRGRTLDNAFIILDEAQNTTPAQMKMFLTRVGFGSKVIITGDATQKDLAPDVKSGLDVAKAVLKDIDEIQFINLTSADVVRHPLVQKIVKAYEDFEKKSVNKQNRKSIQKLERRSGNGK